MFKSIISKYISGHVQNNFQANFYRNLIKIDKLNFSTYNKNSGIKNNDEKEENKSKFSLFKLFKKEKNKDVENKAEGETENKINKKGSAKSSPIKFKLGMLMDIVDEKSEDRIQDKNTEKSQQPKLIKMFNYKSERDTNIVNNPSQYSPKPIILRKYSEEEDQFENSTLLNTSPRLQKETLRKWEKFFKRNTKVMLDLNRAVNNKPDRTYIEFFHDMNENLNDEQFLFALKNLILNKEKDINLSFNDTILPLYNMVIRQKKINLSSKTNLITLIEILYLISFTPFNKSEKFLNPVMETMIDHIRLFASDYKIEEYLLILDVFLNEYNFYDAFLVEYFLERFTIKEFEQILTNQKKYNLKYFNNEVNLNRTILIIIENYSTYKISTHSKFNPTIVKKIENILNNFVKNLHEDNIELNEFSGIKINIKNIVNIFPFETSIIYEKALNNILLQKLNINLNKFYPDQMNSLKLEDFSLFSVLLSSIQGNNFSQDLFEDVFNKICYSFINKLESMEYHNILFYNNEKKWLSQYSEIKHHLMSIIKTLMEISVEHNLYNKNLIEPFLIFLNYETSKELNKIESYKSTYLTLFGKFNFDKILKNDQFTQISLDCYFKILSNLQKFTQESMQIINDNIKEIKSLEFLNFENKISDSEKVYESLKEFYTNVCDIEISNQSEKENLVYEKDKILSNDSNYFLQRFKTIPKKYNQATYINSDFIIHPFDNLLTTKYAINILMQIETVLEYMITLINYKLVKVSHCDLFIKLLNEITEINYNNFNIEFSIYDVIVKEAILKNKKFYEKFSQVLNFVFQPQNYYKNENLNENLNDNNNLTIEKLKNIIKDKYSLDSFTKIVTHNEIKKLNFNINSFNDKNLFKRSLNYVNSNSTLNEENVEFIDEYYLDGNTNLITKMLDDNRFEISHQHFMNVVNNLDKGNLYYDPHQVNLFTFNENLNEFNNKNFNSSENSISKEHMKIFRILMDFSKIAKVIDMNVINSNSISDIINQIDNFYLTHKNKNNDNNDNINNFTINFGNKQIKNLSDITQSDILNSNSNYEYLKMFLNDLIKKENDKIDLKKYKLDKVINLNNKYYPVFPHLAFGITNYDNNEWLILLNRKYKNSDIMDINFENKVSYLKSQFDNILIFE